MRYSTVDDWLAWQETLHPQTIDLGLERVSRVGRRLSLDPAAARVITVAGTNGKGSCVAMLEAILLSAGYRVASYTSPHILRYNERIRIDGCEVSDQQLCQAFDVVDQAREGDSLSYFEFGTLAALSIFITCRPDVVILEVGLGGRLDAVNIIDPDVALISSIAIDHHEWLGTDREQIAREKAGVFRTGRPVVCADPNPPETLITEAHRLGAPFHCLGRTFTAIQAEGDAHHWHWQGCMDTGQDFAIRDLPMPSLQGAVQRNNAAAVIQTLVLLAEYLPVETTDLIAGLGQILLPGRYQRLYSHPDDLRQCPADTPGAVPLIFDVAHNPAAMQALTQTLSEDDCPGKTEVVIGLLADKDISSVVAELLGCIDHWYVTDLNVSRASPAAVVLAELVKVGVPSGQVTLCSDPVAAMRQALDAASGGQDRVLVTGSFYTVGGVLSVLLR